MKKFIVILSVAVIGFGYGYFNQASADGLEEAGAQVELGVESDPGVFCNIESAEVCVVAQTEGDCDKLQGKKVDACPKPSGE